MERAEAITKIQNLQETERNIGSLVENLFTLEIDTKILNIEDVFMYLGLIMNLLTMRIEDIENNQKLNNELFEIRMNDKINILTESLTILKDSLLKEFSEETQIENIEDYFEFLEECNEFLEDFKIKLKNKKF